MQNYSSIFDNNRPKAYQKWAWENTEGLLCKDSSPKIKHDTPCND